MKAIVLAGGLGTRLRERVPDLPKPMAPVAGRPFLEYVLDGLQRSGCDEVVLSVGHLWEKIEAHFGDRYRDLRVRYAVETEPLGTGGALAWALRELAADEPVLTLNGDTFLNVDFAAVWAHHRAAGSPVTMVLREVEDTARYGAVLTEAGRVVRFAEKGQQGRGLINAGTYVIEPGLFEQLGLSGRFSMETDVLQARCAELRPAAFVTDAHFIDIGIPEDFERAQHLLPRWSTSVSRS